MLDNHISKPLGFALIVTVHMVINGPSQANNIRSSVGDNIILNFTFNNIHSLNGPVAIYRDHDRKISECIENLASCSKSDTCGLRKEAKLAFYCINNLTLSNSGLYFATLFNNAIPLESNNISLMVQEKNACSTAHPSLNESTQTEGDRNPQAPAVPHDFPHLVLVLVVFAVLLAAGFLSLVIWSLKRTKEHQQQDPKPTVQPTAGTTNHVPPPSLVYSVLDFPKRSQGGAEIQPTDTEYATISYLPRQSRA